MGSYLRAQSPAGLSQEMPNPADPKVYGIWLADSRKLSDARQAPVRAGRNGERMVQRRAAGVKDPAVPCSRANTAPRISNVLVALKRLVAICGNRDRADHSRPGARVGRAEALTARSSFPSSDLMRSGYNARYRCLR
jgi:hypothetical protein